MKPIIRPPREAELPILVEIEHESFPHPHWEEASFQRYRCLIAEVDGQVLGFIVSRETFSGRNGEPAEREILNLAVAASHRRLGIASALLRAETSEPGSYYLEVRESNIAAQNLYRKLGFTPTGRRPGYYQHPTETAIVMNMKWC